MEFLVASGIGVLTAAGLYLILRLRSFPVIVGLSLLSYAVNLFLFASGRLVADAPPLLDPYGRDPTYTDPLPQALVLTAIVISFGMTAVIVIIALAAYLTERDDRIDMTEATDGAEDAGAPGSGAARSAAADRERGREETGARA